MNSSPNSPSGIPLAARESRGSGSPLAPAITGVNTADDAIHLRWSDGLQSRFYLLWLRDNCPSVRHPGTGQRIVDITELPRDFSVRRTQLESDGSLLVHWAGDRHISRFSAQWLRLQSVDAPGNVSSKSDCIAWDCDGLQQNSFVSYEEIAASPEALRDWLRRVRTYGFALLRDVPRTPGFVLKVASLFAYIRETNYGRLMDIQCQGEPNNLVFSNAALAPHTDNPYRDPVPTLKLLHCLKNGEAADGGESLLVDGFAVAEELRSTAPDHFNLLGSVNVRFRFQDPETRLECERTVLDLDSNGELQGVYFNHRSLAPLRLPPGVLEAYYRAYLAFANKLQSRRNQIRFQLRPGDLYVVDNRRVLHGRSAYGNHFERHLQGCYADRDGLYSRLQILENQSLA